MLRQLPTMTWTSWSTHSCVCGGVHPGGPSRGRRHSPEEAGRIHRGQHPRGRDGDSQVSSQGPIRGEGQGHQVVLDYHAGMKAARIQEAGAGGPYEVAVNSGVWKLITAAFMEDLAYSLQLEELVLRKNATNAMPGISTARGGYLITLLLSGSLAMSNVVAVCRRSTDAGSHYRFQERAQPDTPPANVVLNKYLKPGAAPVVLGWALRVFALKARLTKPHPYQAHEQSNAAVAAGLGATGQDTVMAAAGSNQERAYLGWCTVKMPNPHQDLTDAYIAEQTLVL